MGAALRTTTAIGVTIKKKITKAEPSTAAVDLQIIATITAAQVAKYINEIHGQDDKNFEERAWHCYQSCENHDLQPYISTLWIGVPK